MAAIDLPYSGPDLKQKLLHWAAQYPYCVFLDSCDTQVDRYGQYDFLMGVALPNCGREYRSLDALKTGLAGHSHAWAFGVLTYDLKNSIEAKLQTEVAAAIPFPEMQFFSPEIVISKRRDSAVLTFEIGYSDALWQEILAQVPETVQVKGFSGFQSNFSRSQYLERIERLRKHIRDGDCYEINLTQNFTGQVEIASPAALWEELKALSPVPFAGYARWGDTHLLCASPERFLQLKSDRLLTQPIKGTASRGKKLSSDLAQIRHLITSEKEQAENVMIVDLSRNDLYRSCEVNSVQVPELFEVQTFPQVHHLVSTVTGRKRADIHPVEALKHTFPPGSMTGAPKFRTCQLIDEYEGVGRGIYAGALGYFSPGGDFDFNVVIRSLIYDSGSDRISYHVGGAITWGSDPEAEYEETLIKAQAIGELFQGK